MHAGDTFNNSLAMDRKRASRLRNSSFRVSRSAFRVPRCGLESGVHDEVRTLRAISLCVRASAEALGCSLCIAQRAKRE
jgi:hypothetical protein